MSLHTRQLALRIERRFNQTTLFEFLGRLTRSLLDQDPSAVLIGLNVDLHEVGFTNVKLEYSSTLAGKVEIPEDGMLVKGD